MAKLVVSALRCIEETDEGGNDDPYMVVFRGSFNLPPDVKVVGGKNTPWDGMKTGKLVTIDMLLDDSYRSENAYVIALLEQDANRDILTGGSWGKVAEFWMNNWHEPQFNSAFGRELAATTALALGGAFDNDEFLGARSLPQMFDGGGNGTLLRFEGDGGRYRARLLTRP